MSHRNSFALAVVAAGAALSIALPAGSHAKSPAAKKTAKVMCPVMKAPVADAAKAPKLMVNNVALPVCCPGCIPELKKEPAKYVKTTKDPVSGKAFKVTARTPKMEHQGALFLFSSAATHGTFHKDPAKYSKAAGAAQKNGHEGHGH